MADEKKIVINDEAVEIIARKVLELNDKGEHDSLANVTENAEKAAREVAEKLIQENHELNKAEIAKLMGNHVPKEEGSKTPMVDAIRHKVAVFTGDVKLAAELQEKAGNYGTSTAGGYFAPNENAMEYLDLVNLDSNVLPQCAAPYNMKSNTVTIPTVTAGGAAYSVAESSTANSTPFTGVNMTTGQLTLTAYKHGVYQWASAELLDDSDPAFEAILKSNMVRQLATYIDWGVFHGNNTTGADGSNSLLKGLEGNDVITTNKVNAGGSISFDDILSARAMVQNYTKGSLVMFVNPAVQNQLCGVKDLDGRYIYNPDVRAGDTPTIWGIPVIVNNRISSVLGGGSESMAVIGAFKDSAIIGRKPEVRFIVDPYTYAESTQVKFTVSTRIAFEVASEKHFCLIHGITI